MEKETNRIDQQKGDEQNLTRSENNSFQSAKNCSKVHYPKKQEIGLAWWDCFISKHFNLLLVAFLI